MPRSGWTPSIVPSTDQTVYLVAEDFGPIGSAWREADLEATDLGTRNPRATRRRVRKPDLGHRLQHGQGLESGRLRGYRAQAAASLRPAATEVPAHLDDFIDRHAGDRRQLTLRLA